MELDAGLCNPGGDDDDVDASDCADAKRSETRLRGARQPASQFDNVDVVDGLTNVLRDLSNTAKRCLASIICLNRASTKSLNREEIKPTHPKDIRNAGRTT